VSWNRREVLGGLGIASARALLWAFAGCVPRAPATPREAALSAEVSGEVRLWLQDAVSRLHAVGYQRVHALAVRRTRATAAVDVVGASVSRGRADAAVITAIDARGTREQVTSRLTEDGVAAAVRALAPKAGPFASIDFGPKPPPIRPPATLDDAALVERVAAIEHRELPSRIIYTAGLLDVDDVTVWSVERGRDLVQQIVRVRRSSTRVAWDRDRPSAIEVSRAWAGNVDAHELDADQLAYARDTVLAPMTPGAFPDGEHPIVLSPSVTAAVIDAAVRALLTSRAARRPEVAARLAAGATIASPVLTLVDDPTARNAYGGFSFDDEGTLAEPQTLLDRGRVVGRLADRAGVAAGLATVAGRGRRPGHTGSVEPMPSHLRLAPGGAPIALADGYQLEIARGASVDPASDRVVISVGRALELAAGKPTGRVYADVELVGELGALLASITDASQDTRTFGFRDERDGLPCWRSIEAPFVRGTGMLRVRRRPA
jgi:predicted Zn-dependent protease